MGSPAEASVGVCHGRRPSRVLEGLSQAVAGHLPDRALSGLQPGREDAFPPDQPQDRQPPAPADGRRGDRPRRRQGDKSRGYEVSKGKYVEIEPEEIKAIQVESTHTLDIDKFVPVDEIDRRYFDRPYYIVPDGKAGEEAFAVIRDAMKDKDRVALARIVLTNREHIMAIEPFGKGLLGTMLRYDYEVRDEKALFRGRPSAKMPKEMVKLAAHILDTKAGHFDPAEFKDEFETELRKLVKRKAAGKTIEAPEKLERRPTSST